MKNFVRVSLALFIILNIAGCTTLQKKFTRKKKASVKMPHIYVVKKYEKMPTPELYQKHYSYWMTWQSELIKVLGENNKKDKRCIEEIITNLKDMQNILVKEKGDELTSHIDKLTRVKSTIFNEELTQANRDPVLMVLEREDRVIKREFVLKKVRDYLRKSFDEDEGTNANEQVAVQCEVKKE